MSLESVNDDEEDGVPTSSSITATRKAATGNIDNPDYLRIDISKLPLEMFDSSEYERRSSPEQWLINQDTGVNEGTTTGKSMYWVNGAWSWRGCDVLSYDSIGRKYTIRFRGSQRLKKVKRINLRFDHEDYATFDARVKAAKTKREQCKARLRLRHYMQDMPVEDVRPVRGSILKAICRRIAMPQVSGGRKRGHCKHVRGSGGSGVEHDDGTHGDDGSDDVMLSKEVTSRMLATMLVEVKGG